MERLAGGGRQDDVERAAQPNHLGGRGWRCRSPGPGSGPTRVADGSSPEHGSAVRFHPPASRTAKRDASMPMQVVATSERTCCAVSCISINPEMSPPGALMYPAISPFRLVALQMDQLERRRRWRSCHRSPSREIDDALRQQAEVDAGRPVAATRRNRGDGCRQGPSRSVVTPGGRPAYATVRLEHVAASGQ